MANNGTPTEDKTGLQSDCVELKYYNPMAAKKKQPGFNRTVWN